MVADIQKLESAARLAMGSFEGSFEGPSAVPAKSQRHVLARWLTLALALAAIGLVAATV